MPDVGTDPGLQQGQSENGVMNQVLKLVSELSCVALQRNLPMNSSKFKLFVYHPCELTTWKAASHSYKVTGSFRGKSTVGSHWKGGLIFQLCSLKTCRMHEIRYKEKKILQDRKGVALGARGERNGLFQNFLIDCN